MSDGDGNPSKSVVGYRSPPVEHQFKKGRSGNPRGRPRKAKPPVKDLLWDYHIADLILLEAARPVQIRENDQIVELPMIQAILRSLSVAALKGDRRAQLAAASMVQTTQDKLLDARRTVYQAVKDYKDRYRKIFADYDARDEQRPETVPHPDEIVVDEDTLRIRYNGPASHDEKAEWDKLLQRRDAFREELEELKAEVARSPEDAHVYEDDIKYVDHFVRMVDQMIPDENTRREPGFDLRSWREQRCDPTLRRPTFGSRSGR